MLRLERESVVATTCVVCWSDCCEGDHVHRAQIWRRGLLLKGNGLCHGVAGSGYALLSLYKHTRDPFHLERCAAMTVGPQGQVIGHNGYGDMCQ